MPKITEAVEPEKSTLLLSAQRTLINSSVFRPVAEAIRTFYNAEGSIRTMWKPFTHQGLGYQKTFTPDSASVAEIVQKHAGRLYGWIMLRAGGPDPLAELERWRRVPGMIGLSSIPIGINFPCRRQLLFWPRPSVPSFRSCFTWAFVARAISVGSSNLIRIWLSFSHMLASLFTNPFGRPRGVERIPSSISPVRICAEAFVRKAVRAVGAEKCLYGTDSPYGFGASHGDYDYGRNGFSASPFRRKSARPSWAKIFSRLIGAVS
jgi:hypothetical protein